ncbi:MAG: hypothetical protein B7Z79_03495 [Thiomonas sp. 20-64-9]|jgi:hypothetical protein|uniref:DUF1631 family protein n=1 Tax=Thiomonas TaxID=32012 RepID=UPI000BC6A149|nr:MULTISPECIES: DUF1631 family protein [Thiomonas]OYV31255.1 MAG: hypothetical protein B7Z79_03495 [Thiomonas sp. 20-64-9]OZB70049.1 MAG: hypothetical protein B7X30_10395 [Thiomonas sp. 13-64-67]HML82277.1 DUF1631 family protein [Thiomonas arsenitoxydans]
MLPSEIFQSCIDDAIARSDELMRSVVRQVIEALEQQAEAAGNGRDRQQFSDMSHALRQNEGRLIQAFVDRFHQVLDEEILGQKPVTPRELQLEALSLVDESDLEEGVEVSRLTHMLESEAQWEVRDLGARLDSLRAGEHAAPQTNPLRPEVFSKSLHHALGVVDLDAEERLGLLRAFGKGMSAALKDTYSLYNKRLAELQVEPAQYRQQRRAPARSAAATAVDEQALVNAAQTGAELHLEALQQLLAGRFATAPSGAPDGGQSGFAPSGFGPTGPTGPAASGFGPSVFGQAYGLNPQLRDALDRLLLTDRLGLREVNWRDEPAASAATVNLIEQHRQSLYEVANRPLERLTIDVVSLLFDHILADPKLLPAVKAQLARLQIPVLRLGLRDASLFSSRNHPTRKLLNRVAEYSAGFSSVEEPAAQRFLPFLSRMVEAVVNAEEDDATVFEQQLADLQRHIAESAAAVEQQQADAVDALRRAEFRSLLHGALYRHLHEVFARLHTHPQLREFMLEHWSTVLAESVLRFGEDAEVTQTYKQTASDLIWSVQPKTAEADRKALLKLLPTLVQRLGQGLDLISLPADKRQEFMSWLMDAQAQAIRGQGEAQQATSRDDALLLQREWSRLLHPQTNAAAAAAMPEALVRNEEKLTSGLIEASDVPAESQPIAAEVADSQQGPVSVPPGEPALLSPSEVAGLIASLDIGTWVQLQIQGRNARAQLTWRSPQGLFYMFSSKVGGRAHSMTRRALERMAAQGLILPLEAQGLMDRAMQGVAEQLRERQSGESG